MLRVTELHTQILEALSRYRYLTTSQLQRIGISPSKRVLWRELQKLSTAPIKRRQLVGIINFPASMRIEHVERVHFLTRRGAAVLAEILGIDPEELGFQEVTSVYHRDYWHRKFCIDFHIWLTQALEAAPWDLEIASFDRYFDKTGANRSKDPRRSRLRAETRVDLADGSYLIPDLNFVLESRNHPEKAALFSFEMTNGQDAHRVLEKVRRHVAVMREGALAEKYSRAQNYQALFLFSESGLIEAVARRFAEGAAPSFARLFWLGLYDGVEQNVLRSWRRADDPKGRTCNFVTGKRISES